MPHTVKVQNANGFLDPELIHLTFFSTPLAFDEPVEVDPVTFTMPGP